MGDLDVPRDFVVPPTPEWPEQCWNMNLGKRIDNLRSNLITPSPSQRTRLDELGFCWFRREIDRRRFYYVRLALHTYKDLYGHIDVPLSFVVPGNCSDSDWPSETWDMRLGRRVNSIRYAKTYKPFHKELTELGFVWSRSRERRFGSGSGSRRSTSGRRKKATEGVRLFRNIVRLPIGVRGRRVA
eukprot:gene4117-5432_t